MNKEDFLKLLRDVDKAVASKIYDKMILAGKTGKAIFTNEFYPPNIWSKLSNANSVIKLKVFTYGIFEEAERRVIAFSEEEPAYYPVKLIEIKNKSKFSLLEHKDYLGALMSLGVKREKMGDLVLDGDKCYGAVYEEVCEYIEGNLDLIGKSPCSIREIKEIVEIPKAKFEDKVIISTSYRLDSVVSALCGLSRNKAVEIIGSGKVLVNYTSVFEKDYAIHSDDVLTVRGVGKYRFKETIGSSGSGRLKIIVRKYI
jgi:RNA-binding protein YlmH